MPLKYDSMFTSIRAKLLFGFVAIAVVPLAASMTFGYLYTRTILRTETLADLHDVAPDIETHLTHWFADPNGSNLCAFWQAFPKHGFLRRSEQVYLIDEHNRLQPLSVQPSSEADNPQTIISEGIRRCLETKGPVEGAFLDYRGTKVFGIYRWLGNNRSMQEGPKANFLGRPRVLVIEASEAVALGALNQLRNSALAFSLGLFVLIAITGLLVARGIARPIQQFVAVTAKIRGGHLAERVVVTSRDEIGTLATEFNRMVAKLEDMYNTLEERVDQRTRDLESTQNQLVQAEKLAAVGSLAATIAHEVRNPLAGISGAIQVLGETFETGDTRRDVVKEIHEQINRLDRIINDLLEFAKPKPPALLRCDIRDLIAGTLEHIQAGSALRHMDVKRNDADPLPEVRIDPNQMEQVLSNLMINAAHVVPDEGGELHIETSVNNGSLEIIFRDNGPGIDTQVLGSIFDPFFTTKHRGTGLGLSIARKIVEAHNGSIAARNNDDGGACFIIWLPIEGE